MDVLRMSQTNNHHHVSPTYSCRSSSSSLFAPYEEELREFIEDINDEIEHEDINDYKEGGYHPISMFDILNGQYSAICKLGWGHFSTVWLCWDLKNNRYVAVKVVKSSLHYSETAMDEIIILKKIRTAETELNVESGIVQLLDDFVITGINGNHVCMVFEVLGSNLLDLIIKSGYTGIPLENVRTISKQVLEGLDFIHRLTIIHTDIKPENILMDEGDLKAQVLAFKALYRVHTGLPLPLIYVSNAPQKQFDQERKRKNLARRKKIKRKKYLYNHRKRGAPTIAEPTNSESELPNFNLIFDEKQDWISFEGKLYPPYVVDILVMGPELLRRVRSEKPPDPVHEICHLRVKIGDLGNACYEANHFCENIQTRQYRAPEVILDLGYCHTADIWSLGCMAFELATGEYLFDPRKGSTYSRDEDHLARMIELLGPFPALVVGERARYLEFFHRNGTFRSETYQAYNIFSLLNERQKWSEPIAAIFSHFLEMTLDYLPLMRSNAYDCLQHPFIAKDFCYSIVIDHLKKDYDSDSTSTSDEDDDEEDDEDDKDDNDENGGDAKSESSYSSCGKNRDRLDDYQGHYPVCFTDSVDYLACFDVINCRKILTSILELLEFYKRYFAGRKMRKSIELTYHNKNLINPHLKDFMPDDLEAGEQNGMEIEGLCDRLFQVILRKQEESEACCFEENGHGDDGGGGHGENETVIDKCCHRCPSCDCKRRTSDE